MQTARNRGVRSLILAIALGLTAFSQPLLVSTASAADSSAMVNVNTATAEELQSLPGIGESKAQAILEERKRRGGFKGVSELLEVRGIGEAALEKIRPLVTVRGSTGSTRR